jgi:integration host factor subunit beta
MKCVELFFNTIADALSKGDRVEIRGLCTFFAKEYESCTGRNPKSRQTVTVRGKKLPFFEVGAELKKRVNG